MSEDTFWTLTPKTIQKYFDAYTERQKIHLQEIYLQAQYIAGFMQSVPLAVVGITPFNEYKLPAIPKQPSENLESKEDKINLKAKIFKNYSEMCR